MDGSDWSNGPIPDAFKCVGADLRDWLFPPVCSCCGNRIACGHPFLLCSRCRRAVDHPIESPCPCCAMPQFADHCLWCARTRYHFSATVAWGEYRGGLRRAVVKAKQERWEPLARSLAALLSEKLLPFAESWKIDAVVPIPTHWRRRWQRMTNAAEVLATVIGRRLQLPVFPNGLACRRLAGKQGTLTPAARRKNVRGVFSVTRQRSLQSKNVLLVDDVMTTGATVDEASRMLLAAGVSSVWIGVMARGVGQNNFDPCNAGVPRKIRVG